MQQITPDRAYHSMDKTNWGHGEWIDEPDKIQWVDEATGYDCLIVRNSLGALCGYVGLPPEHPCHGVDYDDVRCPSADEGGYPYPDVHGGLTYAGSCQEGEDESKGICHVPMPGRSADVWWLGFDCAHGMDIAPGMRARESALGLPSIPSSYGESYKTIGYVQRECASLAAQLLTGTPSHP